MPLYVVTALVFVGTAAVLFLLIYALMPRKTALEERLEGLAKGAEELTILEKPPTGMQKFLGRLGAGIPIRVQDYGKYTRRLIAAGIRKERLPVYMGVRVLLAILLALGYLAVYGVPLEKDYLTKVIFTAIFAIAGFLLPSYWLSRKVKNRQTQIFHDLPDVLDLMTVCVQAGLSIDSAMIKICEDRHFQKSPLIDEMKVALQETRAGKQRSEALRDMGERSMVDDLRALSGMLIQTERLGTSLAQALLVHADSLRTKRRQMAEEAAAKVAIKLLFPLVFFIFPALLVVILGPAVLRIIKTLGEF
ncbi:MAG TPA: type II secretion system F family protein [Thermodesulfovibrionales bacterium]|nr:type II secretion system F family protein [Thermodesulfovibrionales bacterium]